MAKVFVHTRPERGDQWGNQHREFARVPVAGEYLTLDVTAPWHQVKLVVHTPFPCDCEAEVYAVEVDHLEALRVAAPEVRAPFTGDRSNIARPAAPRRAAAGRGVTVAADAGDQAWRDDPDESLPERLARLAAEVGPFVITQRAVAHPSPPAQREHYAVPACAGMQKVGTRRRTRPASAPPGSAGHRRGGDGGATA